MSLFCFVSEECDWLIRILDDKHGRKTALRLLTNNDFLAKKKKKTIEEQFPRMFHLTEIFQRAVRKC